MLLLPVTAGAQHGYDRGMFAFGHLGTDEGLASQRIYSILEGSDGAMWFSSKNGVDRYNGWQVKNYELKTSRQFSGAGGRNTVVFKDGQQRIRAFDNTGNVFMYNPLTDGFVGSYSIDTLLQGGVLAGTYGDGVHAVGADGSSRELYTVQSGHLKTDYVYSLWTDPGQTLWIGCLNGDLVQLENGLKRYYPIQQVQCIADMPDGRLAVGTTDGIYAVDKGEGTVERYFLASEFPGKDINSYIQSILFTGRHTAWLATDGGGIYIYDLKRRNLRSLSMADGEICLANNQNTFEIDFECINYKYQHDIVYQYMLEGFDRQWSSASPAQYVRYTNLPAGDYLLHVRSISRNDGHVMDSKTVSICVAQPWWNTWLAWVFYISALLMAAYGVWRTYLNFH